MNGEGFETKTDAVLAVRDELRQRKERQLVPDTVDPSP